MDEKTRGISLNAVIERSLMRHFDAEATARSLPRAELLRLILVDRYLSEGGMVPVFPPLQEEGEDKSNEHAS